jgi:LemA protein
LTPPGVSGTKTEAKKTAHGKRPEVRGYREGSFVQATRTIAAVAVLAALCGLLVWFYNRLVRLRNLARSSWSDIDVMLRKRYDLVGNLVETVKGYAAFEKATLLGVTEARTRAMRAAGPGEKGKEETALGERLSSLFAVAEGYPDLKASESFLTLQKQLAELENGIEYARRYYNAVVRDYNTATETFPSTLVASLCGFDRREFFQVGSPEERERTDVRIP